MLEMKELGPGQVALTEDGRPAGGAAWTFGELTWDRERITVAELSRLEAAPHNQPPLWAYLEFLWEGKAVAAARLPDGSLKWYHKALEKSYLEWAKSH